MPEPSFHTRPLGYDRREVDAFVERTARRLDDALAARSPDAAVREALDRLGEETSSVLQRAHQIADEVTARSQADADEVTARSRAEAEQRRLQAEHEGAAIHRAAEERVKTFNSELEMLWQERQRLLNDLDRISEQLRALVTEADERFPEEQAPPEEPVAQEELEAHDQPAGDAPGAVVARGPEGLEDATQEMAATDPTQELDPTHSRGATA